VIVSYSKEEIQQAISKVQEKAYFIPEEVIKKYFDYFDNYNLEALSDDILEADFGLHTSFMQFVEYYLEQFIDTDDWWAQYIDYKKLASDMEMHYFYFPYEHGVWIFRNL
jgi:lipase chaperone LimK